MADDVLHGVTKSEEAHDTETQLKEFSSTELLSAAHSRFLLDRYGTVDLEPLPDPTPADPLNWPQRKVWTCSQRTQHFIANLQDNVLLETHQPFPRGVSLVHLLLYRILRHPRLQGHLGAAGRLHPGGVVHDVAADRRPRRRAAPLAPVGQALRSPAHLRAVPSGKHRQQRGQRPQRYIRRAGGVPGARRLLHLPGRGAGRRHRAGDVLCAGARAVHWRVDAHVHHRGAVCAVSLWVRRREGGIRVDILVACHCE